MLDMESWQHRRGSNIADMPHTQSSLKIWSDIIDREWQRKLKAGRENRLTLADGQVKKHTCGSIWIDQHRLRMVNMYSIIIFSFFFLLKFIIFLSNLSY